jgi:hypothetical protein
MLLSKLTHSLKLFLFRIGVRLHTCTLLIKADNYFLFHQVNNWRSKNRKLELRLTA